MAVINPSVTSICQLLIKAPNQLAKSESIRACRHNASRVTPALSPAAFLWPTEGRAITRAGELEFNLFAMVEALKIFFGGVEDCGCLDSSTAETQRQQETGTAENRNRSAFYGICWVKRGTFRGRYKSSRKYAATRKSYWRFHLSPRFLSVGFKSTRPRPKLPPPA